MKKPFDFKKLIFIVKLSFIFHSKMQPLISVVIGTRADERALQNLPRLFRSLLAQTYQTFEVILVVDKNLTTAQEYGAFLETLQPYRGSFPHKQIITSWTSSFRPHSGGVSAVRNAGMKAAKGTFIQFLDDDNEVESDFFSLTLAHYNSLLQQEKKEIMLCASVYFAKNHELQSQGFSYFSYRQSRPRPHCLNQERELVQMATGNGIFGKTTTLQSVQYDEQIAWIAEDIDYTLSLTEKGYHLYCCKDLSVYHYEREKTPLERSRIGSKAQAHQKARNRFLFVKKHANFLQKLQFFFLGLPGCILWLSFKAIKYKKGHCWTHIAGIRGGVWEGVHLFFQNRNVRTGYGGERSLTEKEKIRM